MIRAFIRDNPEVRRYVRSQLEAIPATVPVNPITPPNNRNSSKQYPYSACLQMAAARGRESISEK
ncbi:MAG: hypothetical protein ND866_05570 [Pyrinomonadaceae bacterium]|nr:hypothetical protein [Pyrinomonadaceae bacterium]